MDENNQVDSKKARNHSDASTYLSDVDGVAKYMYLKANYLENLTEEEKEKRSRTLKERWKTHEHHSKGVEPWNKGKTGLQEAWNKGKEMEKIECPHCSKMVDKGNAKRWHFDNCKEIKDVSI